MKRFVCNRCGKTLLDDRGGCLNVTCYNPRKTIGLFRVLLGDKREDILIDLCEDCTRELQEWLHVEN